ncbi:MAG: alpha/beta fold hydrolase [Ignavibacteria bacterium]|nr:alpha/beta fold hydrolase [Ignavibacteria bacterium]
MKSSGALIILVALLLFVSSCAQKHEEAVQKNVPQYSIDQFYKNKRISGGTFSSDETRLLVSSDESGIFNVYEINIADSKQRQVTNSTVESFFAADYVPGFKQILYTADKGGDENTHIYLLGEDNSVKDLTPAPKEKATFADWSRDKKAFYYLSNRRDPKLFDVYKMAVGSWKPVMLYKNEKGYDVTGISWDDKTLALSQNITTSENRLFLYSTVTKKMTEVSDSNARGLYSASDFSKDNTSFCYITDAGKEFQYLVRYNLANGERKTVYETTWDVMFSYNSEHEKYRVIGVNTDGKNSLKVIDNGTGRDVDMPKIPDGDVAAVSISPTEKLMRLTVGTSKAPGDIYVYNFDTKELKKLTTVLNPEINADNLIAAEVVRFKSFDSLEVPAIYYKPLNASAENKAPALIWVHGGPGGQSRVGYSAFIQYLVNHGYAILAVNNRGSSGYGKSFFRMDDRNHGDKDLTDCIYGKKYLQTLEYIDKDKIGILGGSYGGFMTMAAMTFHPDEFNVGVDLFGVTNWLRTLRSVPPYWESFKKALYAEMGDPFTSDSVRLYNISPLFHAQQIKHPVMVLQGANDVRVLKAESDEIIAAIKKNNVPAEYIIFPDEGHGFVKKENEIKGYGAVLTFLDKYLKGSAGGSN